MQFKTIFKYAIPEAAPKDYVYHDPVGDSFQQFIGRVANLKFTRTTKKKEYIETANNRTSGY